MKSQMKKNKDLYQKKKSSCSNNQQSVESNHVTFTVKTLCRRYQKKFSSNNRLHDYVRSCRVKSFKSTVDALVINVESNALIIKSTTSMNAELDLDFRN